MIYRFSRLKFLPVTGARLPFPETKAGSLTTKSALHLPGEPEGSVPETLGRIGIQVLLGPVFFLTSRIILREVTSMTSGNRPWVEKS